MNGNVTEETEGMVKPMLALDLKLLLEAGNRPFIADFRFQLNRDEVNSLTLQIADIKTQSRGDAPPPLRIHRARCNYRRKQKSRTRATPGDALCRRLLSGEVRLPTNEILSPQRRERSKSQL